MALCSECERTFGQCKPTKHHRKPRSLGGSNKPANISRVSAKAHTAYHILFGNKQPREIADELNRHWIDPDYRLVAIRITRRSR